MRSAIIFVEGRNYGDRNEKFFGKIVLATPPRAKQDGKVGYSVVEGEASQAVIDRLKAVVPCVADVDAEVEQKFGKPVMTIVDFRNATALSECILGADAITDRKASMTPAQLLGGSSK